jgi:hypothetical protein
MEYCKYVECNEDWNTEKPDCQCGEEDYEDCRNYIGANSIDKVLKKDEKDKSKQKINIPWHANAMGALDLDFIKSKRQPFIIGVAGPPDAGKTTLIAAIYMLLRGGKSIGEYTFSGSYTLLGWEKLASSLSFNSHKKVYFPPHTSSNTARVPGLLHLELRNNRNQPLDLLFTDAPGEWFVNWSSNSETKDSQGAKWIDDHADAFILVADSHAFNTRIGKARNTLMKIVGRMKNTHQNRPVSLVWTKSDEKMKHKDIKTIITDKVKLNLNGVKKYETAVINQSYMTKELLTDSLEIVNFLLEEKKNQVNKKPNINIQDSDDFFFSIRKTDHYE